MRFRTLAAACAAVLAFGTAANATEYVVNGGFETTAASHATPAGVNSYEFGDTYTYGQAVTGWTSTSVGANGAFNILFNPVGATSVSPDTRFTASEVQYLWSVPGGVSPTGGNFVALDGDTLYNGTLSQTITGLTVGATYTLSFDWAAAQFADRTGNTTEMLQVGFGGQSFDTAIVPNLSGGSAGWFTVSHSFQASDTTQVLSFLSIGTPNGQPPVALLDSVSLTNGVPEPNSWALMLIGFGGVGGMMRVARRRAIAAA
jgi:hypothetical protein